MAKQILYDFECPQCNQKVTQKNLPVMCSNCGWLPHGDKNFIRHEPKQAGSGIASRKLPNQKREQPKRINAVKRTDVTRIDTGSSELNRMFGGGWPIDGMIAIAGEPGAGKSTLLMQTAAYMASNGVAVLYVSGEESENQLANRAERLDILGNPDPDLYVTIETDVDYILNQARSLSASVVIVDSIQTLYTNNVERTSKTKQLLYAADALHTAAKSEGFCIIAISQATKDGDMAGPNDLQHLVDAVIHLTGDNQYSYRMLRPKKNRFNDIGEIGVFQMGSQGMRDVSNPSAEFLSERMIENSGSAVGVLMEGGRPILVELQALVTPTNSTPARQTSGFDRNRASILASVLHKHLKFVDMRQHDLVVNVVGGMSVRENSVDLAVSAAIVSSLLDVKTPADWIAIGEIGLTGEIRSVPRISARIKEAHTVGFTNVIVPPLREKPVIPKGVVIHEVRTILEACVLMFRGVDLDNIVVEDEEPI